MKTLKLFIVSCLGTIAFFAPSSLGQQYQVLHKFFPAPGYPYAGVIQGRDGNFYGTTRWGGEHDNGTVFKMNSSGTVTILHSFSGSDGAYPFAGVIQGSDGNFYGTTYLGGATNNGTIFKIDASGSFTTLHSFSGSDGSFAYAGLIQARGGNFYGTTYYGGAYNSGTVFKMDSSGAVTTLHSFLGLPVEGANPFVALTQASDGKFYGTTFTGGAANRGTAFKMDSTGAVTTLHSFVGPPLEGANPIAGVIQGTDGNFYGTTYLGGTTNQGTVFKIDSAETAPGLHSTTTLHSFAGRSDGTYPYAPLIQGSDGNFYGTTRGASTDFGTVFKMDSSGAVTTLHVFAGFPSDGESPVSPLFQASDGAFYGTAYYGGAVGKGTIFKINSSGAMTTVYSFAGRDGEYPYAGLIQGGDGNFYGTTISGGPGNGGTAFRMDPLGAVTTLHLFARSEGLFPYGGLIQGSDGGFYGTTPYGGATNKGTVFKMNSAGAVTRLHSFAGSDGATTYAGLIQGSDGNFYGTTVQGGTANKGTVFKMNSSGTLTTLYSFTGTGSDGSTPYTKLMQGSDGNFYGTTHLGGTTNQGTVFRMDASGAVTTLHSFTGGDGSYPYAELLQGRDGNLYGATYLGGTANLGSIFKIDSSGALTTLHSFTGSDGTSPYAGLMQARDGYFYGTTFLGGETNNGTVFKMGSSGAVTTVHSFTGSDGANPYAGLIQGNDGNFYGTAYQGGGGVGTVFRINIAPPAVQLLSVVSRKTHGTAGGFNVTLPLTGSPGIECRSGGANGDHTLVFTFANVLTSVSGASASATQEGGGSQSVAATGSINPADRKEYIVNLSGVPNAQILTVSLANVTDSAGNSSASVSASMGVLLGDVNQTGAVDGNDVSAVQATTRQRAIDTNFKADVNTSGNVDGNDVSIVQGKTRTRLP